MFKGLRTVVYHINDLEKAKNWYSEITGIKPYFDESFYVGFDINGSELGLDPDMTGIVAGNQSCAFWKVEKIDDCVSTLQSRGAILNQPVTFVGGSIKVAQLEDPWGNTIGLIEGA